MESLHPCYAGISTPDTRTVPWMPDLKHRPHLPGWVDDPRHIDYMDLLMDKLCQAPEMKPPEEEMDYAIQRVTDYVCRLRDALYELTEACQIPLMWDCVPNMSQTTADCHDIVVTLNPEARGETEAIFEQCIKNPHLAIVIAQDPPPSPMLAAIMHHCNQEHERIFHLPMENIWEERLKHAAHKLLNASYVRKHGLS